MPVERTLSIIKADAVKRNLIGIICAMQEAAGLRIVAQKRVNLTPAQAEIFRANHRVIRTFPKICAAIASGPVVLQVLEGENAIERYRKLMGAGTNPWNADPGTIRRELALNAYENAVHGSNNAESAEMEIKFFFSETEIVG